MNTQEQFFYDHAVYSYGSNETSEQGRARNAAALATAETRAAQEGYTFRWDQDDVNSSDFSDDPDPWALYVCTCIDPEGSPANSLGGVDFGRDGDPWSDEYRRVVEAELALGVFNA